MNLSNLPKLKGSKRNAKRVGRGIGSGKGGHTSGRGNKGQKARTGNTIPSFFEGGQISIIKRMPQKRGKGNSTVSKKGTTINLKRLKGFKAGDTITPDTLVKKLVIRANKNEKPKILGDGEISEKLNFRGFLYSKSAIAKITKLGGTAT